MDGWQTREVGLLAKCHSMYAQRGDSCWRALGHTWTKSRGGGVRFSQMAQDKISERLMRGDMFKERS